MTASASILPLLVERQAFLAKSIVFACRNSGVFVGRNHGVSIGRYCGVFPGRNPEVSSG